MTIANFVLEGLAHHRAGRLADAERCYREALQYAPANADALHLLGVVAYQVAHHAAAVELISQAIALNAHVADYHNNLGQPLERLGRWSEAEQCYLRAIALKADYPEAHNNLGNVLRERRDLPAAAQAYRRAIALNDAYGDAHSNLGAVLLEQREVAAALAECQRAVTLNANSGQAHNNLGNVFKTQRKFDAALAEYRTAQALEPRLAESYNNAGMVLLEWRRFTDAVTEFEKAVALKPDYVEAQLNLTSTYLGLEDLPAAAAAGARAVALKPDRTDVHIIYGAVLLEQKKVDEAIVVFHRALELEPEQPEALNNLAIAQKTQGRLDDAIASYRRALRRRPAYSVAHSGLLFTLLLHPGYDARAQLAEHREWDRQHAASLLDSRPHANSRDPGRRLRIGYVSADLCNHAVGRNLWPLFRHHDHTRFEVFAFAHVFQPDWLTTELRACCDHWHDIVAVDDAELAALVRELEIDILVDLSLHTNHNRLLAFARKPAPVQATFAGYPGTTGLSAIDHRLTDPQLDPPGARDALYVERSVRLPYSFWCYDPVNERAEVPSRPPAAARAGLTWGCLNNPNKINAQLLEWWARILAATPDSRLLVLAYYDSDTERIAAGLAAHGIDRHRLEFVPGQTRRKYLETYHRCDVILDTFPYNGHTTGCDALWMGVPVVTLVGETVVSRAGLSLLANVGLPELVATTPDDYVRIAVELARSPDRLAEFHATLRARMEASVLMDAPGFARGIEDAYRSMWRAWCNGDSR